MESTYILLYYKKKTIKLNDKSFFLYHILLLIQTHKQTELKLK